MVVILEGQLTSSQKTVSIGIRENGVNIHDLLMKFTHEEIKIY